MKGERRKNFPRAKSKTSAAEETQKVNKKKKLSISFGLGKSEVA